MGTYIQPLLRDRSMFTKLGRDVVLMALHMHKDVLPYLQKGGSRARQNRSWGSPLLKKNSSSDRKATASN